MYSMNDYRDVKAGKDRSKFRKIIFVSVLVCLLCSKEILSPVLVNAASKKKVHIAYEKVISSLKSKVDKLEYVRGDMHFAYYDINNDGTDELFIQYVEATGNSQILYGGTDVIIYTYKNGKAKKLLESLTGGGTWGGYYFSKNSKYISMYSRGGWSEGEFVFKKLSGGKLVKAGVANYSAKNFDNPSAGFIYKVNGKKVSEKVYNKYVKKMQGTKGLRMYKATNANLKKLK